MSVPVQRFTLTDLPDEVREKVYDHVFASDDVEVAGVLVGDVDDRGKARVHGMIPAHEAEGARASVTFTHEAWASIIETQERDFPDSPTIVGWYHSHPGFGIFLSEHDVFIHQQFFGEQYQVAYVVDPQDETEGIFGWEDGRIEVTEQGRTPRRRGRRCPSVVVDLPEEAPPAAFARRTAAARPQRTVSAGRPPHVVSVDDDHGRRRHGAVPLLLGILALAAGGVGVAALGGGANGSSAIEAGDGPKAEAAGLERKKLERGLSTERGKVSRQRADMEERQAQHETKLAEERNENRGNGGEPPPSDPPARPPRTPRLDPPPPPGRPGPPLSPGSGSDGQKSPDPDERLVDPKPPGGG